LSRRQLVLLSGLLRVSIRAHHLRRSLCVSGRRRHVTHRMARWQTLHHKSTLAPDLGQWSADIFPAFALFTSLVLNSKLITASPWLVNNSLVYCTPQSIQYLSFQSVVWSALCRVGTNSFRFFSAQCITKTLCKNCYIGFQDSKFWKTGITACLPHLRRVHVSGTPVLQNLRPKKINLDENLFHVISWHIQYLTGQSLSVCFHVLRMFSAYYILSLSLIGRVLFCGG